MNGRGRERIGTRRIAMWSGPRNISTAMMRAWGNREDTFVVDEPLYAHYLERTGVNHPGAADVIAHDETDWRKVVDRLTGPVPEGRALFYQKHMAHHLLPSIGRDWLERVDHAFLIRDPSEMLVSLNSKLAEVTLEDTGLPQQVEVYEHVARATGEAPPVVDARDVLEDPRGVLGLLCERLGVAFSERMLRWPPGPRPTDGVWAKHWYASVERSTGFAPWRPKTESPPPEQEALLCRCRDHYDFLHARRLRR